MCVEYRSVDVGKIWNIDYSMTSALFFLNSTDYAISMAVLVKGSIEDKIKRIRMQLGLISVFSIIKSSVQSERVLLYHTRVCQYVVCSLLFGVRF